MADERTLTLGTLFRVEGVDNVIRKIRQLRTAINDANKTLNKLKRASLELSDSSKKTEEAVDRTKDAYTGLNKQLSRIHSGLERVKAAFKVTAAYGIAATAIYGVTSALREGVKELANYDQALKNLEAITGATEAEVTAMGATIRSVAETTKFSSTEVAEGMVLLGQAGFDAGESINAMEATANLATGTLSDMKLTTDLLTTTIRAFNLSAIESTRVADVMANAINKSKLTIDKLRISFNYIAATASQAGLSLEQTAATMMVLANNGLRASTIGTGLRQVLSKLVKPNEKLSQAFEEVSVSIDEANPKVAGWERTLIALAKVLWDSEKRAVDMSRAFNLFGLRGAQAASIIVKSFISGRYDDALSKVYELGTAEHMASVQAEGLAVKFKNLVDRIKLLAIALGDAGVTGVLKGLIDLLRKGTTAFVEFADTLGGQVVLQVAMLSSSIGALTLAFKFLWQVTKGFGLLRLITVAREATAVFGALTLTTSRFSAAIKTLGWLLAGTGPGAIVIALSGIVAGLYSMATAQDRVVKKAEEQVVEQQKLTSSLEAYKTAVSETAKEALKAYAEGATDGERANRKYLATLKRMINAHPELADSIEMTIDAWEKNNEAVEKALSDQHVRNLEAMVRLSREYGKAAEDAKMWAGVWEEIKLEFGNFFGAIITTLKKRLTEAKILLVEIFAIIVEEIGAIFSTSPVFGKYIEKWAKKTAKTIRGLGDDLRKYFVELGSGSEKAKKILEEQKKLWDEIAEGYAGIGKKAKMPLEDIRRNLEGFSDDTGMMDYVINKVKELRSQEKKYGIDIKRVVDEMTDKWKSYFSTLSTEDGFLLVRRRKQLQSMASDYRKYLKSLDLSDAERARKLEAWWDKELDKYIEAQGKKASASQRIHDRLMEKIRAGLAKQEGVFAKIEYMRKRDLEKVKLTKEEEAAINEYYDNKILEAKIKLIEASVKEKLRIQKKGAKEEEKEASKLLKKWKDRLKLEETLRDKVKRLTLSSKDYAIWALDEEIRKIREKYTISFELEGLLRKYREASMREIEANSSKWINITKKTRRLIQTEFGDLFGSILRGEVKSFGDFLVDYWKSVANAMGDIISEAMVNSLFGKRKGKGISFGDIISWIGGLFSGSGGGGNVDVSGFGFGEWHRGGVVGMTPAPVRVVNPLEFINAPRLHNGLAPDEFPAILQKGETVIPKGQTVKSEPNPIHQTWNLNIQAVDAKSFTELARRNPQAIIGPFKDAWKAGNDVRDLIRSTI